MRQLIRYEKYNRKEVQTILAPNDKFTTGAGTWGILGIISNKLDFVFFVTYGSIIDGYAFEEGIDSDGILTWQSQPNNTFQSKMIKRLLDFDPLKNNIYLFLRYSKKEKFTYLGNLTYVTHDRERERPVHFKWQIIDWDPGAAARALGVKGFLSLAVIENKETIVEEKGITLVTNVSTKEEWKKGASTRTFRSRMIDFEGEERLRTVIGNLGEKAAILYERKLLLASGRPDLAVDVRNTKDTLGNNAPYDILSFYPDTGKEKYIEVKTTTGSMQTPFYFSLRELEYSKLYSEDYFLYRIYNFDIKFFTGEFYIRQGSLEESCDLEAINFKANIKL